MTSRYFDVNPILSCLLSSAGMDNNLNRVAGLAMHPVNDQNNQRKGREEKDRKGGGTTVAGAVTPTVLLPILLLLLLPLASLLIH